MSPEIWSPGDMELMVKPAYIFDFFRQVADMIEGQCPKCGQRYYGWALLQPRNQSCTRCGVGLLITEDGGKPLKGYSPFGAEEYKIESPYKATAESETDFSINE